MSASRACPPPNRLSSSANMIDRRPEPRHVACADEDAARGLLLWHAAGIDEPPKRGVTPRAGIEPAAQERARVGQVRAPQRGNVLCRLGRSVRVAQRGVCWPRPRPSAVTAAGVQAECPARGSRKADAIGELLEGADALWLALAGLPLAEPSLGEAGQRGYLPLGDPSGTERGNDRAKVAPGACVQYLWTRADAFHDCPHVGGTDCHWRARFPWSLA